MKILSVRLKNLNSLRGEFFLDFSNGPLGESGLFAITGPTGAGKSTLLDAITLALYGRAARYGSSSPADMMSRQMDECSAEVTFLSGKKSYTAAWAMRRAKTGKLQPPQHKLANTGGEILTDKAVETREMITEITGLDAIRFQRSVLLVQGEFAAFLKAEGKERGALLERITGTEIYSQLSKLAYETAREKRMAAMAIEAQLGENVPLSEEELKETQENQAQLAVRAGEIKIETERLRHLLLLAEQATKAVQEISALEHRTLAASATKLELETKLTAATQRLAHSQSETERWKPILDSARELQATLQQRTATLREKQAELKSRNAALAVLQAKVAADAKALETAQGNQSKLGDWLAEHARDSALDEKLPALKLLAQRIPHLQQQVRTAAANEKDIAKKLTSWEELSAEIADLEKKTASDLLRIDELKTALQTLEQQLEKNRLDLDMATQIMSLDEHRHGLQKDKPCPLCGAVEHPWSGKKLTQVKSRHQEISGIISKLTNDQKQQQLQHQTLLTQQSGATSKLRQLQRQRESIAEEVSTVGMAHGLQSPDLRSEPARAVVRLHFSAMRKQADDQYAAATEELRVATADLGVTGATEEIIPQMEARWKTWQTRRDALQAGELQLAKLQAELTAQQGEVQRSNGEVNTLAVATTQEQAQCSELSAQLAKQLNNRPLEEIESSLGAALKAVQNEVDGLGKQREGLLSETTKLETLTKTARENLSTAQESLTRLGVATIPQPGEIQDWQERRQTAERQRTETEHLIGALQERLRLDAEHRTRREALGKASEAAAHEAARWERLQKLIGSADGSSFARFAQNLTLERLLSLANSHLRKLNPRYRLLRNAAQEMDFLIVDRYQADATRPIASLSGGETFLVSLALALGLSDLASRANPIDSLFIDEGFGTLDSATLETAIDALESLRMAGKTIGIISHVALLQERIPTQIQISRQPDGWSTMDVTSG